MFVRRSFSKTNHLGAVRDVFDTPFLFLWLSLKFDHLLQFGFDLSPLWLFHFRSLPLCAVVKLVQSVHLCPCLPANLSQGCSWTSVSKRPYVALTFVLSVSSNLLDFFLMKRKNWERQIRWKKAVMSGDSWISVSHWQQNVIYSNYSIPDLRQMQDKNVASENLMHQRYVLSGELLFIHSILWHAVYQDNYWEFQT